MDLNNEEDFQPNYQESPQIIDQVHPNQPDQHEFTNFQSPQLQQQKNISNQIHQESNKIETKLEQNAQEQQFEEFEQFNEVQVIQQSEAQKFLNKLPDYSFLFLKQMI